MMSSHEIAVSGGMGDRILMYLTIADMSRFPAREPKSMEDASEDFKIPNHMESLHFFSSVD